MADVELKQINKLYGDFQAVRDLDLYVRDKEFMVLLGPSGSGKTTVLRMIAGLEEISGGEISIGGRVVNDLAPKDRNISMVFQNYALFLQMNVFDNLAFGLRMRHEPRAVVEKRVSDVAQLLGLSDWLNAKPRQLSGGMQQRVALGRAIVREAQLYLLDEPLSNLDAVLRYQMRTEIVKLVRSLEATVVYVTHDQVEAMTMGSRMAVMKDGRIQQVGTPLEIYNHPSNRFVASFIGTPQMNFFEMAELTSNDGVATIGTSQFRLALPPSLVARLNRNDGGGQRRVVLGLRPEDIHLLEGDSGTSDIKGMVDVVEPLGRQSLVFIKSGDLTYSLFVDSSLDLKVGQNVQMAVNTPNIHVFDAESGVSLFDLPE